MIHPLTESDGATKTGGLLRPPQGLRAKRLRAQLKPTEETCKRPNLFPCQDDPSTFISAPGLWDCESAHTDPWDETPSLNPGLWYKLVSSHCEPPSSEKKREQTGFWVTRLALRPAFEEL
jgi:hypothetical protein